MTSASPKKLKQADSTAHPELEAREFDVETQKLLEEIDECQTALETLNEQASEEIIKVEQRINKLRQPYYDQRAELIKRVPNFWATAFTNHPDLANLLTNDSEEDCFQHLIKIDVSESDDIRTGFRIEFNFSENPYFHNHTLVKEFLLGSDGDPTSICTSIDWKEGMSLATQREVTNDQASRKRKLHNQSFFDWYHDHFDPVGDTIADIIKDDFWQTPMQYFLTPDVDIANGLDDEDEDEEDETTPDEDEEATIPQMDIQLGLAPEDPLE